MQYLEILIYSNLVYFWFILFGIFIFKILKIKNFQFHLLFCYFDSSNEIKKAIWTAISQYLHFTISTIAINFYFILFRTFGIFTSKILNFLFVQFLFLFYYFDYPKLNLKCNMNRNIWNFQFPKFHFIVLSNLLCFLWARVRPWPIQINWTSMP